MNEAAKLELQQIEQKTAQQLAELASAYIKNQQWDRASRASKSAAQYESNNALAHFNNGSASSGKKLYSLAIQSYKKALELQAYFPEAYYNLGAVCQADNKLQSAIENYKIAIEQNINWKTELEPKINACQQRLDHLKEIKPTTAKNLVEVGYFADSSDTDDEPESKKLKLDDF